MGRLPFILLASLMPFNLWPALGSPSMVKRPIPKIIYGITTDNGYDIVDLPNAIESLSRNVCTRIVFDENVPASDYLPGASAIHNVSFVMGLVADSSTLNSYTPSGYSERFKEYFDTLQDKVDIWEIGNEINGPWTGPSASVVSKVFGAFDLARRRNLTTALTLYYNTPCQRESDREMFHWSEKNLPESIKLGVDYVFISYYEDDCPGTNHDWNTVFNRLAQLFPNSKVGFGEIGTTVTDQKKNLIKRYYELSKPGVISEPRFVGGYFYWYFHQDMVPKTKFLWSYLDQILGQLP